MPLCWSANGAHSVLRFPSDFLKSYSSLIARSGQYQNRRRDPALDTNCFAYTVYLMLTFSKNFFARDMLRMLLLSMLPHHPIWFLVYTSLSPFGNEHSFTLLLYHRSGEKAIEKLLFRSLYILRQKRCWQRGSDRMREFSSSGCNRWQTDHNCPSPPTRCGLPRSNPPRGKSVPETSDIPPPPDEWYWTPPDHPHIIGFDLYALYIGIPRRKQWYLRKIGQTDFLCFVFFYVVLHPLDSQQEVRALVNKIISNNRRKNTDELAYLR